MGAESFVVYSRAQWNTVFTLEEAVQIRADWLQAFPENEAYFQWVQATASDHGGAIQQFKSGRWRGGATYSAKCNGYFQGRCADGALAALRVVVRETLDPKKGSPLYGFRLVNFVHDEIIMEGPLDRCSEAAQRLADVMLSEFNEWVIDVPIRKVTPCVMLTWSKKAQTLWDPRDPSGKTLLPWDLQQVAA
jgi:DNA polymerase I-like protein with 3'-5' exonuclease and polymerase domains